MKGKIYLLLLTSFFLNFSIQAQQQRNCSAMDVLEIQEQESPKRAIKLQEIEKHTQSVINNPTKAVNGIITIPTVVHVLYNTNAENISDAQIMSQLQVMNDDFRRQNSDADNTWSQAADTEIEFCLASVDPNGNSTTGITRTYTSTSSFSTNDAMKYSSSGGKDAWPASDYLNMWVCDIGGGILGYAQFPGGASATDGVVMGYKYFGTVGQATAPFDGGRTTTHEIGHWLNLRHIWGDGACGADDYVSDTPTSDAANYGCAEGHVSCSSTDMVQNFMDYSDDKCMNLFTAGQKARMRALFASGGARASLLNSNGCGNSGAGGGTVTSCNDGIQNGDETGVDCGGSCGACSCNGTTVSVTITLDDYPAETSWSIVNASGSTIASGSGYSTAGATVNTDVCISNSNGCFTFIINDSYGDGICCGYGNGSYTVSGNGGILASGGSFASSESTNFCLNSQPAPTCNDGVQNGNETGVDCGGSCDPCNTGGGVGQCTYYQLYSENFENGWGYWTDGGVDCRRSSRDASYASSGSYCVRIRDNNAEGTTSTVALDLTGYDELTVEFSYYARSMESNEDFWLQISNDGGNSFSTVETWAQGSEFSNYQFYTDSAVIPGPFSGNDVIRFRCDATTNSDLIYLDDIIIYGCANGSRVAQELVIAENIEEATTASERTQMDEMSMIVYPVPASDNVNIDLQIAEAQELNIFITDLTGRVISKETVNYAAGNISHTIDTDNFANGTYLISVLGKNFQLSDKFVVIK